VALFSLVVSILVLGVTLVWGFQSGDSRVQAQGVVDHENSQTMILPADSSLFSHRYLGGVGGATVCLTADGRALEACDHYNQSDRSVESSEIRESIYVVKEGDTISEIASMFGVSSNTVIWANDIDRYIHEGQHLVILPFTGVRHQIKDSDTLSKIADHYDVEVDDLRSYNSIFDDQLAVGEFIDVVGGVKPKPAAPSPTRVAERSVQSSGSGVVQASGYFIRPIRGGIRSQGLHGRNAVDLAAPPGTPIYAAASGEVIVSRTGWNSGYGNYIEIRHDNGTRTLYAHNSQNIVSVGQYVQQGQVIGYVGSTGLSTGPHVHFEVHGAANPF